MSNEKSLKKGDAVEWNSQQGKIKGQVIRKVTKPMKIKTHEVKATPENPQFLVKSKKTGAEAAHSAAALKKSRD